MCIGIIIIIFLNFCFFYTLGCIVFKG